MNIYIYGGCLFDENPKDFDLILECNNKNKDIFKSLKYELNSFGGAKISYNQKIFDVEIVEKLSSEIFIDRFVELDSDCVYYDMTNNIFIFLPPYWNYVNNGYASIINKKSIHPILGIKRREQRIEKANNRKDYVLKINKHIKILKDFIEKLNFKNEES